ncbi:hypothetical protein HDV00_012775 [Rhizophlyctis rosea]|nr:hypothetical protein HDV00_012775 [Rhizophlyctis rosea]
MPGQNKVTKRGKKVKTLTHAQKRPSTVTPVVLSSPISATLPNEVLGEIIVLAVRDSFPTRGALLRANKHLGALVRDGNISRAIMIGHYGDTFAALCKLSEKACSIPYGRPNGALSVLDDVAAAINYNNPTHLDGIRAFQGMTKNPRYVDWRGGGHLWLHLLKLATILLAEPCWSNSLAGIDLPYDEQLVTLQENQNEMYERHIDSLLVLFNQAHRSLFVRDVLVALHALGDRRVHEVVVARGQFTKVEVLSCAEEWETRELERREVDIRLSAQQRCDQVLRANVNFSQGYFGVAEHLIDFLVQKGRLERGTYQPNRGKLREFLRSHISKWSSHPIRKDYVTKDGNRYKLNLAGWE